MKPLKSVFATPKEQTEQVLSGAVGTASNMSPDSGSHLMRATGRNKPMTATSAEGYGRRRNTVAFDQGSFGAVTKEAASPFTRHTVSGSDKHRMLVPRAAGPMRIIVGVERGSRKPVVSLEARGLQSRRNEHVVRLKTRDKVSL